MPGIETADNLAGQITRAIGAHGQWKARLRTAIDSGTYDVVPAEVRLDDRCEFGTWLHSSIAAEERSDPNYATVKQLHANFHQRAADVLEMVARGDEAGARRSMDHAGAFADASAQLTQAMMTWQRKATS